MSKSTGIVSDIKGLVTLDSTNGLKELKNRDAISENGGILTTSELSNLTITFEDGREVRIGPEQQIMLDEMFFENNAYDENEISFTYDDIQTLSSNQTTTEIEEENTQNDIYNESGQSSGDVDSEQIDVGFVDANLEVEETDALEQKRMLRTQIQKKMKT